ncbi:hypothetical protein GALL_375460 [mine drainage metagenome]|uniref:Uncharacterized protein n=1 Tax=mine drainage metagenome TaxID=410659 RepID=A0A1J5QL51_9ZZZZ
MSSVYAPPHSGVHPLVGSATMNERITFDCAGPVGVPNENVGVAVTSTYAAKVDGPGAAGRESAEAKERKPVHATATTQTRTMPTRRRDTRVRAGLGTVVAVVIAHPR